MSKYSPIIVDICSVDSAHILDDRGEPPTWPLNVVETLWFLGKFYPKELYDCISSLKEKGYSQKKIAELLIFPTRLTDLFHFIEIPIDGLTIPQKVELFEEAVKMAGVFRKDPFCKNNRNEIWSKEKIKMVMETSNWYKVDSKDEKVVALLSKLHALMFLYSEFIWVGGRHQLSHELHGPYPLNNKEILFVREYYDLKPEVWPFAAGVPLKSFTLLEIYEGISIKLDCYNHLETLESLPQKLKSFALLDRDYHQVSLIYDRMLKAISKGNDYVEEFQKEDWMKKAIEMQAWSIKPLKDALHKDWRPSPSLFKKIKELEPEREIQQIFQTIGKIMSLGEKQAH